IPIAGPNRGRGRTCYVCKFGSAPVIAAFIRPDSIELEDLVNALQALSRSNAELRIFIVFLSSEDSEFNTRISDIAERNHLTIPLNVLPEGGLPPSLGVNLQTDNTFLFYRGRQLFAQIENVSRRKEARPLALDADFAIAKQSDVMTQLLHIADALTALP